MFTSIFVMITILLIFYFFCNLLFLYLKIMLMVFCTGSMPYGREWGQGTPNSSPRLKTSLTTLLNITLTARRTMSCSTWIDAKTWYGLDKSRITQTCIHAHLGYGGWASKSRNRAWMVDWCPSWWRQRWYHRHCVHVTWGIVRCHGVLP